MVHANGNAHDAPGYLSGTAHCTWENDQHAICVDTKPLWKRPAFWATVATLAAFAAIIYALATFR